MTVDMVELERDIEGGDEVVILTTLIKWLLILLSKCKPEAKTYSTEQWNLLNREQHQVVQELKATKGNKRIDQCIHSSFWT